MKHMLIVLFSISLIALTGCSGKAVKEGIDVTKAAEDNAVLGLRYMQQGNYERALLKLNKAIGFDNRYGPAYHYRAELYRRLEEYEKADQDYRDAVYYSEDDYSLYNNYGIFLCSQGRYDEGEKQLLRVLDNPVYPRKDQVYENLGLCVEKKPDLEQAEQYLRTALRLNPRLPKALLAMARLSFEQGNNLGARAHLQRYLEVARHTAETLWLGIRIERLLGDRNTVSSYGLQLKSNFPTAPETKWYLESGGN